MENDEQALAFWESRGALVAVKGLSQRINCHEGCRHQGRQVRFFLQLDRVTWFPVHSVSGGQALTLRLGVSFLMACTRKKEKELIAGNV